MANSRHWGIEKDFRTSKKLFDGCDIDSTIIFSAETDKSNHSLNAISYTTTPSDRNSVTIMLLFDHEHAVDSFILSMEGQIEMPSKKRENNLFTKDGKYRLKFSATNDKEFLKTILTLACEFKNTRMPADIRKEILSLPTEKLPTYTEQMQSLANANPEKIFDEAIKMQSIAESHKHPPDNNQILFSILYELGLHFENKKDMLPMAIECYLRVSKHNPFYEQAAVRALPHTHALQKRLASIEIELAKKDKFNILKRIQIAERRLAEIEGLDSTVKTKFSVSDKLTDLEEKLSLSKNKKIETRESLFSPKS